MKKVEVELGRRSYTIWIDSGVSGCKARLQSAVQGGQVFIISNDVVAPLYLQKLKQCLDDRELHEWILKDGESVKNLQTVAQTLDAMVAARLQRNATVIALGGGVVGDIAGFAAACYQRGVPFIQVPTTLLAQVDSSVGGKTGVNHAQGKNLIGAFYQPQSVLIDPDVLQTLAPRQFSAGLAEVIKYGLIRDDDFLLWLGDNMPSVMDKNDDALQYIIQQSCLCKAQVVQQDELEGGVRALLNFGHTFGHAIETATDYAYLHGEAVAIGMLMAADMSCRMGLISDDDVQRVQTVLTRAGLGELHHKFNADEILRLMTMDKKVVDGAVRLVLLKQPGDAFITADYDEHVLQQTVRQYAAG